LVVPVLFLLFFGIIQTAYTAYTYFAVQRAALAIARTASLSGTLETKDDKTFQFQLGVSLLPLVRLNAFMLPAIAASQYDLAYSSDFREVIAQVRYPMPILVPLAGKLFGTRLQPPSGASLRQTLDATGHIASLLNVPVPRSPLALPPIVWITCQAATYNEGYTKNGKVPNL
jgi:hypothetical protein